MGINAYICRVKNQGSANSSKHTVSFCSLEESTSMAILMHLLFSSSGVRPRGGVLDETAKTIDELEILFTIPSTGGDQCVK